jgi:hypothetical protein
MSNFVGTWRAIRQDGINTIVASIERNGVLEDHLWFVMSLPEPEDHSCYIAIDCNHHLIAFKQLKIPKARALVFPHLDEDTYALIAG